MFAQLTFSRSPLTAAHQLVLLPLGKSLPKDVAQGDLLVAVLKRRDMKADELAKSPVAANAADGTLAGEADHILATRFLKRFVEHDTPRLHMDLSSSRCEGGLGIVAGDVNGFGVAWGLKMLQGTN